MYSFLNRKDKALDIEIEIVKSIKALANTKVIS